MIVSLLRSNRTNGTKILIEDAEIAKKYLKNEYRILTIKVELTVSCEKNIIGGGVLFKEKKSDN